MSVKQFTASKRLQQVQTPVIPEIAALIEATPGTISLGQGVVYYPPPPAALDRVKQFENRHEQHIYSDATGIPALRETIMDKLRQENAITDLSLRRVVVTAGSNMAFLNALLAIADAGDEIILLKPYYFNHEMAITMLGCQTVAVDCDSHYQPDLQAIRAAITSRTRAIVTVSPNNPSGAVYPAATLQTINELCREQGLFHISDEAYEYFTYDDAKHFSPACISGSEAHTISLFSLSKAFGFASWRIGYMLIPEQIELAIKKVQDTNLICPSRISQEAAIEAIKAGRAYCLEKREHIETVRSDLLNALDSLADICEIPCAKGAFYFLLRMRTELTAMAVVQSLIKRHRIAVIPGETFGLNEGCYLRVAYGALDRKQSEIAAERLVKGLQEIIS